MFKGEKLSMFTKGLGARILNTGVYSVFFYLFINRFGNLYGTKFEE
jgi:hypothetical protein